MDAFPLWHWPSVERGWRPFTKKGFLNPWHTRTLLLVTHSLFDIKGSGSLPLPYYQSYQASSSIQLLTTSSSSHHRSSAFRALPYSFSLLRSVVSRRDSRRGETCSFVSHFPRISTVSPSSCQSLDLRNCRSNKATCCRATHKHTLLHWPAKKSFPQVYRNPIRGSIEVHQTYIPPTFYHFALLYVC